MNKTRGDRAYNIDIFGLSLGSHDFEFAFDNSLFDDQENKIVSVGNGVSNVLLEKSETLITLYFEIKGEVELVCDRSLERFMFSIDLNERLILKYGDDFDDGNDEVWVIPFGFQTINVKRNLLEFINVAIPMKRLHPKFENDESEEPELVYSSEVDEETEQTETDPRWEELKKIKNLNN